MLNKKEIGLIEEKADGVIKQAFGKIDALELPVDLNVILDNNALILKTGDFEAEEISGAFDRASSTIFVSNQESAERQAFTVAHELGHYVLHADMKTEVFYRNRVWQFDAEAGKQEQMANWFAAALLMPKGALKRLWNTTQDIEELSRIFGVSKSAMYFRTINLDLI